MSAIAAEEYNGNESGPDASRSSTADESAPLTDNQKEMWAGSSHTMVVVRVRPILRQETDDIVRVLDNKMVVVLDPGDKYKLKGDDVSRLQSLTREKYAFDYVFERGDSQLSVYQRTTRFLIDGVLTGYNATVFAYGCGRRQNVHVLGSPATPGIMALTLEDMFHRIAAMERDSGGACGTRSRCPSWRCTTRPSATCSRRRPACRRDPARPRPPRPRRP